MCDQYWHRFFNEGDTREPVPIAHSHGNCQTHGRTKNITDGNFFDGGWNDEIDALIVPPHMYVDVWEHGGFKGNHERVNPPGKYDNVLGSNRVSSFRYYRRKSWDQHKRDCCLHKSGTSSDMCGGSNHYWGPSYKCDNLMRNHCARYKHSPSSQVPDECACIYDKMPAVFAKHPEMAHLEPKCFSKRCRNPSSNTYFFKKDRDNPHCPAINICKQVANISFEAGGNIDVGNLDISQSCVINEVNRLEAAANKVKNEAQGNLDNAKKELDKIKVVYEFLVEYDYDIEILQIISDKYNDDQRQMLTLQNKIASLPLSEWTHSGKDIVTQTAGFLTKTIEDYKYAKEHYEFHSDRIGTVSYELQALTTGYLDDPLGFTNKIHLAITVSILMVFLLSITALLLLL